MVIETTAMETTEIGTVTVIAVNAKQWAVEWVGEEWEEVDRVGEEWVAEEWEEVECVEME